ncbi:YggT family protein [Lampropedia puyangensis]|uniref:YggT family protein n=1 Tax=Lampropedia puyangensis TaxID=1330072 RepID=A0A4S8FC87_9BURK|nr:YggT family protein [Lampropedia puyangensis]THU04144.1 YggT family protein [Lampropedia puyangensis]
MLYEIFAFLLGTLATLLVSALLLRTWLQGMRVSFTNPLGQLVIAITSWLVRPTRKLIQAKGRWDWVCVLLAYLVLVLQYLLLIGAAGQWQLGSIAPIQAAFALLQAAVWLVIGLLLIMAILSWIMPGHWLASLAERLCQPLLAPLRGLLPSSSGIDVSPMVLSLLLYIVLIVIRRLEMVAISPVLTIVMTP